MNAPDRTVGQWLDVMDEAGRALPRSEWRLERIRRQHGLQIALDVIAHAQHVPLRLFRYDALSHLDKKFVSFVERFEADVLAVVGEHGPAQARRASKADGAATLEALKSPRNLQLLRDWVLSLAQPGKDHARPADLPEHYEHWVLELQPHAERELWLTDMSNPHPAHAMARMVEHWSLYVLMWAWRNADRFGDGSDDRPRLLETVLEIEHLATVVLPVFDRIGLSGEVQKIGLLVGPFELESDQGRRESPELADWFVDPFQKFLDCASHVPGWEEAREKAPNATELRDAFSTRVELNQYDAEKRAKHSGIVLQLLRATRVDDSVCRWPGGEPGRPLSRANWETVGALCTWVARWTPRLRPLAGNALVKVAIPRHRLALRVRWSDRAVPSVSEASPFPRDCLLYDAVNQRPNHGHPVPVNSSAADIVAGITGATPDLWIEEPAALLARARERQHALWTSQINAIGNLLARHSRREQPLHMEDHSGLDGLPPGGSPPCGEADHLLRGYSARICRHIMQMARAQEACILWLDYSTDPPQLRHAGGAERLIQHRARRTQSYAQFSQWASEDLSSPRTAGSESESQLYRAVAIEAIDPRPEDRSVTGPISGRSIRAHFAGYAAPQPQDSVAVPLIFSGRVVGVFNVVGVACSRQFNQRLYAPLRVVAQTLAQAMAMQVQFWQMRRLTWLASRRPMAEWRQHTPANRFNPLRPVAQTLTNVFLCPVVHIWLQDRQNPRRFKLHGYTRDRLFAPDEAAMHSAPSFMVSWDLAPASVDAPLNQPFSAFAADQWRDTVTGGQAYAEGAVGGFVQARFQPGVGRAITSPYHWRAGHQDVIQLHADYLDHDSPADPRKALFGNRERLWQCMTFPLIDTSDSNPNLLGVVSLHGPDPPGDRQGAAWPADWRHMVAHMQAYLPYILMQMEAIANPLDNMRRYLLHEGRSELNTVASAAGYAREALAKVTAPELPAGRFRPWLRRTLPRLEHASRPHAADAAWRALAPEVASELVWLDRALNRTNEVLQVLLSPEHAENIGMLGRMIEHQRELAPLGDPSTSRSFTHKLAWMSPRARLRETFAAYQHVWQAIQATPDFGGLPDDLEILTSESMWALMTRDLVYNMAKYATDEEPITVGWSRGSASEERDTLKLCNYSSYQPTLDTSKRLFGFGVQGSAGMAPPRSESRLAGLARKGQGIGLWGAAAVSKVMDMPLHLVITPRPDGKTAFYSFEIMVPKRLTRRSAGFPATGGS
jgi:hypothetical protein